MSATESVRTALADGQALTAPEIATRCTAHNSKLLSVAIAQLCKRGILTRTGERGSYVYTLAPTAAAPTTAARASRAATRSAFKGRGAGKKRPAKDRSSAPRHRGARQQPHDRAARGGAVGVPRVAMTADLELVLAGENETVLYTAQETQAIARVILQHFES